MEKPMHQIREEIKDYFKGFLIPDTTLNEWAITHDLSLKPIECPYCGRELLPDIPFATKTMRGLIYEQCQCDEYPNNQAPFLYGAADPKERQRDREFSQSLYDHI
jgi:hypothetical protein